MSDSVRLDHAGSAGPACLVLRAPEPEIAAWLGSLQRATALLRELPTGTALSVQVEGAPSVQALRRGDSDGPVLVAAAAGLRRTLSLHQGPILATARGHLQGPWLTLALSADILAVRETMAGSLLTWEDRPLPLPGDVPALATALGRARALELALGVGEPLSGAELVRRGAALEGEAAAAAVRAALAGSRVAQVAARGLLGRRVAGRSAAEALERAAFALCFAAGDRAEGVAAFLERRPPQFDSHAGD